jgi:glucose-6-phosphate isomerase
MQESAKDDPGRCFAVYAEPGDVVIVPPNWAHATIVGDVTQNLTFGAWCVRDYGFDYDDVCAHGGIAWFPQVGTGGMTTWAANPAYRPSELEIRRPRSYAEFGLRQGVPIYQQFVENPDLFLFVSKPQVADELWQRFEP